MTGVPTPFDPTPLLAAHDFVRRLARSLVFDQDRVDDIVQEAWLAASRRPPREHAAVAGWFARVVRNLARRGARDANRRRAREAAAARSEVLPSTADVLEREQQRRRVVDAVLALPEPYRATVLARFFDDLPPHAIARRRGVPAATVRSQLHRALEMLRLRLDAEHGGDRRAWSLLLLPLARPARAAGTAGLATFTGVLLMGKVMAVAGALALAALGVLWLRGGAGAPPSGAALQRVAAGNAPATGGGQVAADRAAADGPARVAVPAAADERVPAGDAGLRGRVLWSDGQPAADQLVRVVGIDGLSLFADAPADGDRRGLALAQGSARTAADGTFAIAGLPSRARYALHAGADGRERTLRLVDVTPEPDAVTDLGDLVLEAKGTIAGRAVDGAGAPVGGAEVLALDLPAALAAVLPFDRLRPEHGGMLSVPLPAADGADLERYFLRLRSYLGRDLFTRGDLDRDKDLTVLVVEDLPWLETLWQQLPLARATSAPDGRFELRGVEPGGNLLIVRRDGLASGMRPRVVVGRGAVKDVGDVALPAGERLLGCVRDAGGRPAPGAEVRVATIGALGYRGVAFGEAPTTTDAQGRFAVAGLPRGRAFVAVRRSARDPWLVHGPVATDDELELVLPAPQRLELAIERQDGARAGDARVTLFAGPPLGELRAAGLQTEVPLGGRTRTAADGLLVIEDLLPGCYTVQVDAPGAAPAIAAVTVPCARPLRVALAQAHELTVRVRDEAGGPIAGAKVYVEPDDAPRGVMPTDYGLPQWYRTPRLSGLTDRAGSLRVEVPAAGATVHAMHPRFSPASAAVAAADAELALVLPRAGLLRGRLFEGGRPADPHRFRIVARPLDGGVPGSAHSVPLSEVRTGLRADGTFECCLPPAEYALHAEPVAGRALSLHALADAVKDLVEPDFLGEDPVEHRIRVESGGTATVEFDVDPNQPAAGTVPARLRGRVLVDGGPIAGGGLLLRRSVDMFHRADLVEVAADGSFVVPALPPGRAVLQLIQHARLLWQGEVDLAAGQERVLDLCWSTCTVRGQLVFPAGFPVAGCEVEARVEAAGGALAQSATSDAAGRFVLTGLPAGKVELQAKGKDGKSAPLVVETAAGTTSDVRLELREVLVLSGRIDLGDRPAGGSLVFAKSDRSFVGTMLAADGSFHFSDLEPGVYTLALSLHGQDVELLPSRFDLSQGQSRRDVLVRIAAPAGGSGR